MHFSLNMCICLFFVFFVNQLYAKITTFFDQDMFGSAPDLYVNIETFRSAPLLYVDVETFGGK